MRLFIAVPVPEPIRTSLAQRQRQLEGHLPGSDIRWQDPERAHLTLLFLGEVAEGQLPGCRLALKEAVRGVGRLNLSTGRLGVFPARSRPSVIWLGVDGDVHLLHSLHRRLSLALEGILPESAQRTYRPHLTLGRVRRLDRAERAILDGLLEQSPDSSEGWTADSLQLIQSHLRPGGPEYRILTQAGLG